MLKISRLRAGLPHRMILDGIDLAIAPGEVHVVMGPNGSGKSTLAHVMMGKSDYLVHEGSISLDGNELISLPTWQRAQAGLFLAMQDPIEVPGVTTAAAIAAALLSRGVAASDLPVLLEEERIKVGLGKEFLDRSLNVDLSGGERKRNETVQLAVIKPKYAILDEIDSGLDVDALSLISRRIEHATQEWNLGVLTITHYKRLLNELKVDGVHVMVKGRIVESGGPELAAALDRSGYSEYLD